ncbi:hypothetical protein [Brevibacillus agri]|uniref:hypothetical protein n=1 Tax=Brevibacillus agri TaxID=51101 RepID=UPI0012FE51FB|nr:hypothetical protein [Brevibacillus agri]
MLKTDLILQEVQRICALLVGLQGEDKLCAAMERVKLIAVFVRLPGAAGRVAAGRGFIWFQDIEKEREKRQGCSAGGCDGSDSLLGGKTTCCMLFRRNKAAAKKGGEGFFACWSPMMTSPFQK